MRRGVLVMATVFVVVNASSQDRPVPDGRRELAPPAQRTEAPLPTIDLPEFVITGASSISLPVLAKIADVGPLLGDVVLSPPAPSREKPAASAGLRIQRQVEKLDGFAGTLDAGIGAFSTPKVSVAFVQSIGSSAVSVQGGYARSSGFKPHTDWSEGRAQAAMAMPLNLSPAGIMSASLNTDVGFVSKSYSWFGSATPSAGRRISNARGNVNLSGRLSSGWDGGFGLGLQSLTVTDSSSSVVEGLTSLRASGRGVIATIPTYGRWSLTAGGRSGNAKGSTSVMTFTAGAQWTGLEFLSVEGWLSLSTASSSGLQSSTHLLPGVRAAAGIDEKHRLVGFYGPTVTMTSLSSSLEKNGWIASNTQIRHSIQLNAGRFGIESDWTQTLRSRVEVETATSEDEPLLVDSTNRGSWNLVYGGRTTSTGIRAEVVANVRGNDYFSATLMLRTSSSAASGLAIPSLPGAEVRFSYLAALNSQTSVRASYQHVSRRESRLNAPTSLLPGYSRLDLRGEMALDQNIGLWTELSNATNTVYQHWYGYQEQPFRWMFGVSLSW